MWIRTRVVNVCLISDPWLMSVWHPDTTIRHVNTCKCTDQPVIQKIFDTVCLEDLFRVSVILCVPCLDEWQCTLIHNSDQTTNYDQSEATSALLQQSKVQEVIPAHSNNSTEWLFSSDHVIASLYSKILSLFWINREWAGLVRLFILPVYQGSLHFPVTSCYVTCTWASAFLYFSPKLEAAAFCIPVGLFETLSLIKGCLCLFLSFSNHSPHSILFDSFAI